MNPADSALALQTGTRTASGSARALFAAYWPAPIRADKRNQRCAAQGIPDLGPFVETSAQNASAARARGNGDDTPSVPRHRDPEIAPLPGTDAAARSTQAVSTCRLSPIQRPRPQAVGAALPFAQSMPDVHSLSLVDGGSCPPQSCRFMNTPGRCPELQGISGDLRQLVHACGRTETEEVYCWAESMERSGPPLKAQRIPFPIPPLSLRRVAERWSVRVSHRDGSHALNGTRGAPDMMGQLSCSMRR